MKNMMGLFYCSGNTVDGFSCGGEGAEREIAVVEGKG